MTRAKCGVVSKKRHKKVLNISKGYVGRANRCFRIACTRVEKGLQYSYRDRRNRKREVRKLWIQRINAAARKYNTKYSTLINKMNILNIKIDRKMLAQLALKSENIFSTLVNRINK